MDAATSNPLFQAVDKMLSRASLPDVKAPVDLLALIQEYGDAKYVYGAQSVSDRWHQEYADAPDLGPITEEVERLQGIEYLYDMAMASLRRAVWLYENYGLLARPIPGDELAAGRWANEARAALAEARTV